MRFGSRGFPCGKRYRRGTEEKEKKLGWRKRKEERTRSAKKARGRGTLVEMAMERGRTGVAGYRTRGGFHGGVTSSYVVGGYTITMQAEKPISTPPAEAGSD
ncbi:hypothetical protein DBV15_07162 [Temnothorax longispinosus]|uniref:Uncharacterized protein n=1 Tax=Temnothorax longispinosus TaxID=300112 RepID=A0A4S2KKL5_9HYME|nr:hypothetical protein DBV15_07162 [Temnothorax longispinosus]